MMRKKIFAVL